MSSVISSDEFSMGVLRVYSVILVSSLSLKLEESMVILKPKMAIFAQRPEEGDLGPHAFLGL
jgi:hypothetical protein